MPGLLTPQRTLCQAPKLMGALASFCCCYEPWSHFVILHPSHVPPPHLPLLPRPLLQHTHGLAQLVRAQRPQSLSAEVAGASHGHGHFCWVGTRGSLVRGYRHLQVHFLLPPLAPLPVPTSCQVKDSSSKLDQEDMRALELGTPRSLFRFGPLLFVQTFKFQPHCSRELSHARRELAPRRFPVNIH